MISEVTQYATAELESRARAAVQASGRAAQFESKLAHPMPTRTALYLLRQTGGIAPASEDYTQGDVPPSRGNSNDNGARSTHQAGASDKAKDYARSLIRAKLPAGAQAAKLAEVENGSGPAVSAIIDRLRTRPDLVARPATDGQLRFVNSLRREREMAEIDSLPFADVTATLAALKATPIPAKAAPESPDVAPGYYALATGEGSHNSLAFYNVRPRNARGYINVNQVIGGESDSETVRGQRIYGPAGFAILNRLAAMTDDERHAANRLFSSELGRCRRCARLLTQDHTRAAGIGDKCASKE